MFIRSTMRCTSHSIGVFCFFFSFWLCELFSHFHYTKSMMAFGEHIPFEYEIATQYVVRCHPMSVIEIEHKTEKLFNAISLAKNRFYIFLVKHIQHKYFTNWTLYPRRIFHHSASLFDCSVSQCWPIRIVFPAHNILHFWLRFLLSFHVFSTWSLVAN